MSYKAKTFIKTITVISLMLNSSCASYLGSTKQLSHISESLDNGVTTHRVNLMSNIRYPVYRNRVDLYSQGNIKIIDIDFSNGFVNAKLFRSQIFRADEVFVTEVHATFGAYAPMYLYATIMDALMFTIPVFFGYAYFDSILHEKIRKSNSIENDFGNISIITSGLVATDLALGTYLLSKPTIYETYPVTNNFFDKETFLLPNSKVNIFLNNKEYSFITDKNSFFSLPLNTITLGKNNGEIINIFDKDNIKFKKNSFNLEDSISETNIRVKWEKNQTNLKKLLPKITTPSYKSSKNSEPDIIKKSAWSAFKKAGTAWAIDKVKKKLLNLDKSESQNNISQRNMENLGLAISLTQSYLKNNNLKNMAKEVLEDELTSMLKKKLDIKDSKFVSSFIYYFVIELVKELYPY